MASSKTYESSDERTTIHLMQYPCCLKVSEVSSMPLVVQLTYHHHPWRFFTRYVGLKVLTAVVMKSFIFWDIMPCSPLAGLHPLSCFVLVSFLLGSHFNPEDGGDMYLQNVGWLSTNYMAIYPRRKKILLSSYGNACRWAILRIYS
jgi:hypothetical protein